MLTACSQDDLVSGTGAITFNNAYVDNQTRADNSITTDNISEIYVYGYRTKADAKGSSAAPIFENEEVTKGTDGWDYKNTQYWVKGETFAFTAITPSSDNAKWEYAPSDEMTDGKGTLTFNNEKANADYDLCTAVQAGITPDKANYSTAVAFTLQHRLARVKFELKNSYQNTSDYIEVSKLQLNSAISQGTLNTSESTNTWSNTSGTFNITLADNNNNKLTVDANTKDTDWSKNTTTTDPKFLIPDAKTTYTVELKAEVKNGNGTINVIDKTGNDAATITIDGGFQAGYSYTILVDFTGDEIKFTVKSVATWGAYEEIGQNASANSTQTQ
jgi:hypothetical protein